MHGLRSDKPFLFSAAVPEGLYDVTVTLGHPEQPSLVTVKAEARTLMLRGIPLRAGEYVTRTFTVAVKRPLLKTGRQIGLKASQPDVNWDDRLTLEFNGTNPSVVDVQIALARNPVNVFIAGDSTVIDQSSALYTGWGQMLPRFFGPGIAVTNNAQSGDSLRSFRGNGLLNQIWEQAKPGDYLLIQFGDNDQKDTREGAGPFTTSKQELADNSHFDNYGGYELARIVATGIANGPTGLKDRLRDDFEPFDPSHPDAVENVVLPLSPVLPTSVKPEGS